MTDQEMQLHLLSDNMITSGPSLKGGRNDYSFWQFHYHWGTRDQPGSEHTINGVQYPAEVRNLRQTTTSKWYTSLEHISGNYLIAHLYENP